MAAAGGSQNTCSGVSVPPQPVLIDAPPLTLRPMYNAPGTGWHAVAVLERVLAAILLVLLSPVLGVAVVTTVILSRQSPLVAHQRVGRGGRTIWILKLRTMWRGRPSSRLRLIEWLPPARVCATAPKAARDERVTSRFAAFCRRFSVDELPQLWQVLCGDLALVGPRPLTRIELMTQYRADAGELLTRAPGISGLWQTRGRSRLSYRQRRRLDLFLVRKWSLPLYCRILLATIPRVVSGKDAW